MSFNTYPFAIFIVIVYLLYLSLNHKWQNRMLLVASYVFYGSWDWRFLSLLFVSTLLSYFCGIRIFESTEKRGKKIFLGLAVFGNLSILGFFKYFDFFAENLQILFHHLGIPLQPRLLHIILPVGISFYTFQSMGYSIDVYRDQIKPTYRFFDFALFISFFTQLLAGPIERAGHLLPQILSPRQITLTKFYEGIYLISWGLFQKMFIADSLANIVDPIFASDPPYSGTIVLIGTYAFVFQVLCDFDGYSNIARGLGKMMGFDIFVNFNLPLFATNIQDFWRRWHITLSSWVRDYLYISLGGNRKGNIRVYINLMISMVAIGFWHGAAWHYIWFGVFEGSLLILYRIFKPYLNQLTGPKSELGQKIWLVLKILFMFQVTSLGYMFFRSRSITQTLHMLHALIFNFTITPDFASLASSFLFFVFFFLMIQIYQFKKDDLMIVIKWPAYGKTIFALVMVYLSLYAMILGKNAQIGSSSSFIYFQF